MKRVYGITIITAVTVILAVVGGYKLFWQEGENRTVKAGFVYVGDASTAYTSNFMDAQEAVDKAFGDKVQTVAKYNVAEGAERQSLEELVEEGCDIIFATSYGYETITKELAEKYPDVQFCMATGDNANTEQVLDNYHTFMGAVYEGRYVSGVVAGMKLQELIGNGTITKEQARIGYVGAYPYAEVISGYTAFLLGVRSVVPEATMEVCYTNTWSNYLKEKKCAQNLIDEGCVIISQHSDTAGPAVACEQTDAAIPVYLVGYNQSMAELAPTTYLTGAKINWTPYMRQAVQAVLDQKRIEDVVAGNVNGQDVGAGFDEDWVQMLELNEVVAAPGTKEKINATIEQLKKKQVMVFQGDYIGVNPQDASDICDLTKGYQENAKSSAPTFYYILKDVIEIKE